MYDKKFYTLLDYVFADEGGFSNQKMIEAEGQISA